MVRNCNSSSLVVKVENVGYQAPTLVGEHSRKHCRYYRRLIATSFYVTEWVNAVPTCLDSSLCWLVNSFEASLRPIWRCLASPDSTNSWPKRIIHSLGRQTTPCLSSPRLVHLLYVCPSLLQRFRGSTKPLFIKHMGLFRSVNNLGTYPPSIVLWFYGRPDIILVCGRFRSWGSLLFREDRSLVCDDTSTSSVYNDHRRHHPISRISSSRLYSKKPTITFYNRKACASPSVFTSV